MTLKAFSDAQIQSALDRSNAIEKRKIDQVNSLTPAQHATTINIAGRTGLPRDLVERNQELLEQKVREKDQRTLLEKFPALKNVYLNDRNLGGLLQNDAQSLFDATKSAFFDTGVGFDMPDGSRRYFTRRPTAEDFPITADGGFAKSSADLRMAQERWDGRNGSLGNGIAAGSYFGLNQRQRSMEEMDDLVGDSLAYGYERFKRIFSNNLDESGLFDGLYEQQRRVAEANGIYYNRNQDRAIREANRQRELEALMPSLEVQAQMQQISETKTIGQAIQAMVRNPKAATVMYFQSLGTTAPAMAITLAGFSAGGAPGGVVATALGSFSIEYGATIEGTMLEYGLNPDDAKSWETYFENEELLAHAREKAVQRGIPIALFDAATAGIAGRFIRNADPSASSFLPRAGAEMAVQAGGGAGGEATAQYVSGEEYKPADIVLEAFAELPTAVPEAFGNYVAVRVKSESRKEIEDNRAKNAVENASLLRQVVGLLSNSEALKQGDAGRKAVAEVLNQSAPDETVTISARETQRILQENNIPLQSLNEAAPSLVRQLPDALSVGGDVVINRGELIGAFAQTPAMEPLIEHVRMTPDAMTLAESQEYAQSGDEKLAAEMDALATRLADDEIFQASKNRVYDTVLAQLNLANRFTSAKNEVDAALISAYFSTRASQLGVMPEELLNETGFNVRAEGVPDQVLDQDFIGTPDGTVKFSRKRFAQLFSEHMYPDGQVHAAVAFINPQDFVNATTVGREEAQTIADDVADEPTDMAKMQQDILPYLDVEVGENGAVRLRNHEGRHRMQRLADAGYTRVPVRFVNRDAEYGDRSLLGLQQNGEIGGQRFYDGATSESTLPYENLIEITPDNKQLLLDTFEASESDAFMQGANQVTGDLSQVNEAVRNAAEARIAKLPEEDQQRIRANLEEHKGTSWAAAAVKGMAYREMLDRALAGEDVSDLSSNPIWGKQDMAATTILKTFKKYPEHGEKLLVAFLNTYDFIGGNRKAENDISTSFTNCNPSKACAVHCYAAGANARPNEIAKSEFTEFMIEHFPEQMAEHIANQYLRTAAGQAGLSLRLNDKGDLSPAQVNLIALLNERDIALQVFSKRPELLRSLSDMNLKMLSIDSTNMDVAEANPDLRLAVTITDEMTEEMLMPIHDRVSVYLPVNLKGRAVTQEELKSRFPTLYPRMRKENLCPVDGGKLITKPKTSFVDIRNKTADKGVWTCTSCDLTGCAGCFKGDRATNQRKAQVISTTDLGRELKVRNVRNELQSNLDQLLALGGIDNETHRQLSEALSSGERSVLEIADQGTKGGVDKGSGGVLAQSEGSRGRVSENDERLVDDAYYQSEARADYAVDLFGVPDEGRGIGDTGFTAPTASLWRDDARGTYATRTEIVEETKRELGSRKVTNRDEAAKAMAYLARGAVERFDALITDAEGKPLAVVGSFKGTIDAASVYPFTLITEAFRVNNAANIWFAHNHPSGQPNLSNADIALYRRLENLFEGSSITPRGLFAIGGQRDEGRAWTYVEKAESGVAQGTTTKPLKRGVKVPVVERVLSEESKLGPKISSPDQAIKAIQNISNGENGVLILDSQNAPVGFVPINPEEASVLRTDGRMDALYRAISMANGGGIIVGNFGSMSPKMVLNLSGFFGDMGLRVLDVIEPGNNEVISWAKEGRRFESEGFQQGTGQRGSFEPTTNTIRLLQSADLSTFLHEAGHYFFENDIAMASRLVGKGQLTLGEQQIVDDVHKLLNWHGFEGPVEEQINTWYSMTLDQKRGAHEKTAESFERYLFAGEAPSVELESVFRKFRAWLINVYQSIKDFLARYPDAKALNPEIREVFDRMLATDNEIAAAQATRSQWPMFNAENSSALMTADELLAYQAVDQERSEVAKEELGAKGARDMQWAGRRVSREVRRLQRESKDVRSRVRMEVRREIMSQPIYQAWSFLTRKATADDKLPSTPEPAKSVKGPVDPEIDTLFTAIAKLGGLNREEVTAQWGVDPKERSPQPLFGMPVVRKEGGRSIDDMVEALSQYGYLTLDENGKADVADLEAKFDDSWRGDDVYSTGADYNRILPNQEMRPGDQIINPQALGSGRLDATALSDFDLPPEMLQRLKDFKMLAKEGIHPDVLVDMFPEWGFTSGDQLVRELATTEQPAAAIEGRTDQIMLERFAELSSEKAIEDAAAAAVHNEVRARMVATELEALGRSIGRKPAERRALVAAANEYAARIIARTRVRDLRPSKYDQAAARSARAALEQLSRGNQSEAYIEKRNEVLNSRAARASFDAIDEVQRAVNYLKKFDSIGVRQKIDAEYLDQIDTLLERFDLSKSVSGKTIDKRKALTKWIESQEDMGIEVDLPEKVRNEAFRQSYKEMTMEELRGLVESVKQIEHLGRLKDRLLTAKDQRQFKEVVKELVRGIEKHAGTKWRDNRTRENRSDRWIQATRNFLASHRKIASLARQMDGFEDAGPVWTYLIESMNRAGDMEAQMRADATQALMKIMEPILAKRMLGKGIYFKSLGKSLNRAERMAIALNMGNEGNIQRLIDGNGFGREGLQEVVDSLSKEELDAVQAIWDHFESYRPMVAEKEKRISGKEPEWIQPMPLVAKNGTLRGGYFPIVYDPKASGKAEQFADAEKARQEMRGAFVASTTRRSYTKTRAAEVAGRPVLLTFDGLWRGVNEVIHDLSWHEWVIDANRIIRNGAVDQTIRNRYGSETVQQFKTAIRDIAAGERAGTEMGESAVRHARAGAAIAGLGFNLMNAAIQTLGVTQTIVRIGPKWFGIGVKRFSNNPKKAFDTAREKSTFMRNRMKTMQREVNEIQSIVQGKTKTKRYIDRALFIPMQAMQMLVDLPTWYGAYEKALAQAPLDMSPEAVESRAIALADQAVIDSQSSGQTKDLANIQRGSEWKKMFTVFYGYFSSTYNLAAERTNATNFKNPAEVGKLAMDYLMLIIAPSVLYTLIKAALQGELDDDDLGKKVMADQVSYILGMWVGVREFTPAVQAMLQLPNYGYAGPGGLRIVGDTINLMVQIGQGDADRAAARAAVNALSVWLHLPGAQINRTLDGIIAIADGKTSNPGAVLFGKPK